MDKHIGVQARQTFNMERRGLYKVSTLDEKLLSIDSCLEKEGQIFLKEWLLVGQLCFNE